MGNRSLRALPNTKDLYPLPDNDTYKRMRNIMKDLILYLLEKKYLIELPDGVPEKDCIVLYFNGANKLQYAGIVDEVNVHDSELIVRRRWRNRKAVITAKSWYGPDRYDKVRYKFYKQHTPAQAHAYLQEFLDALARDRQKRITEMEA